MTKKNKIRTIDGKTLYLAPGIYELEAAIPNPHLKGGFWPEGSRLVIEKHTDHFGGNPYEHFSMRIAGHRVFLIKSYETEKWNPLAARLRIVKVF